jgi:hypothetical protein
MLTAPAVDDEVVEPLQEFNRALDECRRCLVFHSEGDNTLKIAFRIGDGPEFDRALGFKGPQHPVIVERDCPDVFVVDCKNIVHSHGGYRTAPAYYEHWSRIVGEVPLPRFEALENVSAAARSRRRRRG